MEKLFRTRCFFSLQFCLPFGAKLFAGLRFLPVWQLRLLISALYHTAQAHAIGIAHKHSHTHAHLHIRTRYPLVRELKTITSNFSLSSRDIGYQLSAYKHMCFFPLRTIFQTVLQCKRTHSLRLGHRQGVQRTAKDPPDGKFRPVEAVGVWRVYLLFRQRFTMNGNLKLRMVH